jgi:hypothetical protein
MDSEGYPEEKELEYIKQFDCIKQDVHKLIDYIEDIWWLSSWGFIKKELTEKYESRDEIDEKPYKHKYTYLELHTGGWSGNEDIITALQQNRHFFIFYWTESRVGGHYTFKITLFKKKR